MSYLLILFNFSFLSTVLSTKKLDKLFSNGH